VVSREHRVTLKRIELNKKLVGNRLRARLSRTGGPSLSLKIFKGLTYNTSGGLSGSKTKKGLTVGFGRGGLRLRGRWRLSKSLNLNLSKRSGFSLSWRNSIGSINLSRPQYSSAKVFGMQFRGKKAQSIQGYFLLFSMALFAAKVTLLGIYYAVVFMVMAARLALLGAHHLFSFAKLGGASFVVGAEWLVLKSLRKLQKRSSSGAGKKSLRKKGIRKSNAKILR
jgi:hypothetical protein